MTQVSVPAGPALVGRARHHALDLARSGRSTAGRYPLLLDAALVVLVGLLSVIPDLVEPHDGSAAWLFDLLLVAPLLVRRRWPVAVLAAVSTVALTQWLAGTRAQGDLAVLVALYTVGAYEARRHLIALAAVVAEIGVVLAVLRWAPAQHRLAGALLLTGTVTAALVGGVYVRVRRAYLAAVLERALTAERDRDRQAQLAVADERARIAREMHDIVAHSLTVIIALNDGAAATALTDPRETRLTNQQAATVGRQSMAEMRRLLGVLRAGEHPTAEADLAPQPDAGGLDALIDQVRAAGLPVELTVSGSPDSPPAGAQLAVHRIVQESLTNVLKHAPAAARTIVRLDYRPDRIDVQVTNDDPTPHQGGDRSGACTEPGHGLVGIGERAAVYGGQVHAGRGTDGSWQVTTRLHLDCADGQP